MRDANRRAVDQSFLIVDDTVEIIFAPSLAYTITSKDIGATEAKEATGRRDHKNPCPPTVKFYDLEK